MRIAAADIALESYTSKQQQTEIKEQLTQGYVRAGDAFNKNNLVEGEHIERSHIHAVSGAQHTESTYSDIRRQNLNQEVGKYSLDQLLRQAI